MNREREELLHELRRLKEAVRLKLNELVESTEQINDLVEYIADLRPDVAATLVAEAVLQPGISDGTNQVPIVTLAIRVPGGLGLCVWPNRGTESNKSCVPRSSTGAHFVPLHKTPPVVLRMLVPNLESLLEALRLRIER